MPQEYERRFNVPAWYTPEGRDMAERAGPTIAEWCDATVAAVFEALGVVRTSVQCDIIVDTYRDGADDAPRLRHRLIRPEVLGPHVHRESVYAALPGRTPQPGMSLPDDVSPLHREPGDREELTAKIGKGADRMEYNWPLDGPIELAGGDVLEKVRWSWQQDGLSMHVEAMWPKGQLPLGRPLGYVVEIEGPVHLVDAWSPPPEWSEVTGKGGWRSSDIARNGWPKD